MATIRLAEPSGHSHPGVGWMRHLIIWDWLFVLVVVVVSATRYSVLVEGGAPPTIDSGNWLAYADQILGSGIRSESIVYPPVAPLLVAGSVSVLGLTAGVAAVAALAAAAPGFGVYAAGRWSGIGGWALGPALLALGASSVGEAAAWGGFPQLIGFGLLPAALMLIDRAVRSGRTGHALGAGIATAAIAATSHFVLALTVSAGLALVASGLGSKPRPGPAAVGLFVLPSLWLAPVYAGLFAGYRESPRESAFFNEVEASTLIDQIEFLYRDAAWLWRILLAVAVGAILLLFRQRSQLWRIATALSFAVATAVVATRESRFLYAITVVGALGLAAVLQRMQDTGLRTRRLAAAGLVAAVCWQIAAGSGFFPGQRSTYGILTPDLVAGLEEVAETAPSEATLAITSLRDAPVGWWVEAITDRRTIYGAPLRWLLFADEIERAEVANRLFVPPFPDAARIGEAAGRGIDLVLVPTDWVFYDEDAMTEFRRVHPDAVEEVTPGLIVIDAGQLGT